MNRHATLKKVYFGRGQWAILNREKGHSIGYGFDWEPCNTGRAFSKNIRSKSVTVYLRVERYEGRNESGEEQWSREEIVSFLEVGSARYFRDADKIGRAGIREHILGLIDGLKDRIL